jgi:stress-induced morphogen
MWQYLAVPTSPELIRGRILAALPDATIDVRDTTGGGDHFDVRVLSSAFAGRPLVARHQMVYAALGDLMRTEIHALALTTDAPSESKKP